MTAAPSAPPSTGSVPPPTSSSSTSAGSSSARSIATRFAMCAENVLRLAAIDCSSPMSAKIERNGVNGCRPRPESAGRPAPSARAGRTALSATVLPPVFGPEITSARVGGATSRSRSRLRGAGRAQQSRTEDQQRMARAAELDAGRRRASAGATPSTARASRAFACSSSSSAAASSVRVEVVARRTRNALVSASRMRWISSLLAFGERDDVVVERDGRQRLEIQARAARRAPCTMPGIASRCSARTTTT